jgi:uncharacterized FlaG/YvyC family protein
MIVHKVLKRVASEDAWSRHLLRQAAKQRRAVEKEQRRLEALTDAQHRARQEQMEETVRRLNKQIKELT